MREYKTVRNNSMRRKCYLWLFWAEFGYGIT